MLDNTSLKNEVKSLKIEVASFSKFEFKAKLRKLLKKLLEFLLSKYFKSFMKYDEKNNKIFFKSSPIYIEGQSLSYILYALNEMLTTLFSEAI